MFVSGDVSVPQRLFWRQDDKFFGRELTANESLKLDELIDADASAQAAPSEIGSEAPGQVRLACIYCDIDEFDGVNFIPDDWMFVTRVQSYEESLEEIAADDLTRSPGEWHTHVGVCPDCQTTQS